MLYLMGLCGDLPSGIPFSLGRLEDIDLFLGRRRCWRLLLLLGEGLRWLLVNWNFNERRRLRGGRLEASILMGRLLGLQRESWLVGVRLNVGGYVFFSTNILRNSTSDRYRRW